MSTKQKVPFPPGPWAIVDGVSHSPWLHFAIRQVVRGSASSSTLAKVPKGFDDSIAIARLIAAAPDLLDALRQIERMAEAGEYGIAALARAAIEKAVKS